MRRTNGPDKEVKRRRNASKMAWIAAADFHNSHPSQPMTGFTLEWHHCILVVFIVFLSVVSMGLFKFARDGHGHLGFVLQD